MAGCGADIRRRRMPAGLTLRDVATATGTSRSAVCRLELGQIGDISLRRLAAIAEAVGLDARLALFPAGDPIRDAAHVRLLERLRARLHPGLRWRTEVPLPREQDRRAWHATISDDRKRIVVEAETRLTDLQALERRLNLKLRDGGEELLILLVAETRNNRAALRAATGGWRVAVPIGTRAALATLGEGRLPTLSAIVVR
jgi:transcriptional regulator with XRE-family HTH domain